MNDRTVDVLIVGAGPTGLAAAIELGSRGIDVLVVEMLARTGAAPRAKTTNARTRTHLRRWGIADRLAEASPFGTDYPNDMIYVTRLSGHELCRFENAFCALPIRYEHFPEHAQWVPQYKLEEVMFEKANSFPNVEILFDTGFVTAEQSEEEVTATIEKRDGERQTVRSKFLIGADGARSMVRDIIGATMAGNYGISHHYNIIFRAPGMAEAHDFGPGVIYWQMNRDGFSAIGPMDDGDRWFFMPGGATPGTSLPKEDAAVLIRESTGIDLPYEVLSADSWTASQLCADFCVKGRMIIAGDAAHLHPPTGGYGMNMGVGDGVDIGWKIAAVLQGWGGPGLIESYDVERGHIHQLVVDEAVANFGIYAVVPPEEIEDDTPEGAAARKKLGETLQVSKAREFQTLGIVLGLCYEGPQIARESGEAPPLDALTYTPCARPGCLAPHAWLADGRSLYDAFGSGFTLLVAEGASDAEVDRAVAEAEALSVPLEVLRPDGVDVARLYEADLVLIRPDQHISWRGNRWTNALSLATDLALAAKA